MNTLALITLIDSLLTLATSVGISIQRIQLMREQSPSGQLTDEQKLQLARERDEAIAKL